MATYVNDLRLKEIATGDEAGTWGTSTNTNLELIAEAFSFGTEAITTDADTHTTTIADGATDPGRSFYLKYTGTLDSACTITIGPNTVSKFWLIENATSGSQNIIISQGSGANVTIPAGEVKAVYSDGAGSGAAVVDAFAGLKVSDAAQTNITSLGTLTTLTVDDITINGSTISDAGDLTIDSGGDIILDADGGEIVLKDGGTSFGQLKGATSDFIIQSLVQDKDIIFKGDDGGGVVTALTLDMSAAGAATFNNQVTIGSGSNLVNAGNMTIDVAGDLTLDADGGDIIFSDGGSEKARFNAGDLGIGTSSPSVALHVSKSGTDAKIRIQDTDGTNQFTTISQNGGQLQIFARNNTSNGSIQFLGNNGSASSEYARFDNSGNMGIGTASPDTKLHIIDALSGGQLLVATSESDDAEKYGTFGTQHYDVDQEPVLAIAAQSSSSENNILIGGALGEFNAATSVKFFTAANATTTTGSERMRINSSGNVAIGHTSPEAKLDVDADSNQVAFMSRDQGSATYPAFGFSGQIDSNGNRGTGIFLPTDGALGFAAHSAERMRVNPSGVGIGSTNPSNLLHIAGASGTTILELQRTNTNATGTTGGVSFTASDGHAVASILAIGDGDDQGANLSFRTTSAASENNAFNSTTEFMRLTSTGDLGIGTSSPSGNLHLVGPSSGQPTFYISDKDEGTGTGDSLLITKSGLTSSIFDRDSGSLLNLGSNDVSNVMTIEGNNSRVGIGTTSPAQKLHIIDTSNPASPNGSVVIEGQRDGTANLIELRARDNSSSSSALPSGQGGIIRMNGFDGSDFEEMAFIGYQAEATVADGDAPSRLIFGTTSDGSGATTEKMRLTSAGRLGIGTTSPSVQLDVEGDTRIKASSTTATALTIKRSSSSGRAQMAFTDESDNQIFRIGMTGAGSENFSFFDGSDTILELNRSSNAATFAGTISSGAIAIGQSTFSGGNTLLDIHASGSGTGSLVAFANDHNTDRFFVGVAGDTTGNVLLHNAENSAMLFATNNSERMRIHSGGSVSIGSTTSSGKLFVNGNLRVDGAYKLEGDNNVISQSGTTISIGDVSENDNTVIFTGYGATSKIELNDGFIPISTNGSERVRIDGNGDLFVGKTSSNSANTGVEAKSGGLLTATRAAAVAAIFNRTTSDGQVVQFRKANTTVGSVSVTGSATTYNTSSDLRLKDITGSARGLEVVNELNPVAYNWKESCKSDEGLIAQEVQELVPNAVSETEEGYYQMDYSKLVTHLIKAVQEQQEQIEKLQKDSHTPKNLEDMSGYKNIRETIDNLVDEVKLLKGGK